MATMNPYNFVRLQSMATDARRVPLGHKVLVNEYAGERVYQGRINCLLTNFSPFIILSHLAEDLQIARNEHKIFKRFFHYPNDPRPVIPATSLKGMVRSIAEAISNSCLSVLNETYVKRWDEFADAYPPSLRFCGRNDVEHAANRTEGGLPALCPTCRIFGTAAEGEESGTSERGVYPLAFQGKVRFSDATFVGEVNENAIYQPPQTLIPLIEPKVSKQVWYADPTRRSAIHPLSGRKFYYHHDDQQVQTTNTQNKLNSTIRPLQLGGRFTFQLEFRNLLESELALLLYALELEPAKKLIKINDKKEIAFEWQQVKRNPGVYPKLGYGKPAGLGSVCVLVTQINLHNPLARYGGETTTEESFSGEEAREFVKTRKDQFWATQASIKNGREMRSRHFGDLCRLLRFPNGIERFRYPILREFGNFKANQDKLPLPGREGDWDKLP